MARILIGNVYPGEEYLLKRCAPAGYGLGKQGVDTDDLNTNEKCGYLSFSNDCDNRPFGYGAALVLDRYDTEIVQLAFDVAMGNGTSNGAIARRVRRYGEWDAWEFLNPPMQLNQEYLTTDRWNNKPVYTMLVDCGTTVAGTTTKAIPFEGLPIRYEASAGGVVSPYYPNDGDVYRFEVFVDGTNITLTVGSGEAGKPAYVQVWYVK